MADTYETISRPYDKSMNRDPAAGESASADLSQSSGSIETSNGSSPAGSTGSVAAPAVTSEGNMKDVWIETFIKSVNWQPQKQGFYIDGLTGYAEFANVFISGNIQATVGVIGGWTIGATTLSSGSVVLDAGNEEIRLGLASGPLTGSGVFIGKDGSDYEFRAGDPAGAYMHWDGTILALVSANLTSVVIGTIGSGTNLSIQGWQLSSAFSAPDADTVAWGAGTLTFPDGQTFAISGGNTGNIAALTYIYFDKAASTTVLQTTTTAATAVGTNKVLIAVAQNNADVTKFATFQVFGGAGGMNPLITADNIAAGTITADEISANTITANKLDVSELSAITADMGDLTAGTITLPSGGHVKSGQSAYDTGTGFWLGNDGGTPKFSIGDSAGSKVTWNGTTVGVVGAITGSTIDGSTITGGTIQTAASGLRVVMTGADNDIQFYSSSDKVAALEPNVTGDQTGLDIVAFRTTDGNDMVQLQMRADGVAGQYDLDLQVGPSIDGILMEYLDSDGFATIDFNARIASDIDPDAAGTRDLGSSSLYWDVVNYKTLTDRGCLGWYDDGVELQDGRVVSDTEALKNIKKHPTWKTPAGADRMDYKTMPKHVYQPADKRDPVTGKKVLLPRDENDLPYDIGPNGEKIPAQDGAETTALISIMLGAIKELTDRVEVLEAELGKLKKK